MLALVAPAQGSAPTGGHVYNHHVLHELDAARVAVVLEPVPGAWPHPSAAARARLLTAMSRHPLVLVDGLVGAACPDEVATAERAGTRVVILVHLPLPKEPGLATSEQTRLAGCEERALRAASAVVATSHWAARDLRQRYRLGPVAVALPGADRAPVARGSSPPHLLTLASFTPGKNQATLLRALERLDDLEWTAAFVGRRPVDEAATQAWERQLAGSSVRGRVEVPGPLVGPPLERHWSRTDVLVLPSRVETFGLVVTEAFAHGIPALVGAGTGAVETLAGDGLGPPPGGAADPSDPDALAEVLRAFLTNPQLRERWRRLALARRERLRPWSSTAHDIVAAMPNVVGSGR